ncbi:MAG: N-acetyltransferase family protein, partial [Alphaproteobacteria bacterium]
MNNLIKIEKVIKEDILQILEIYNYYINFGLANFEEEEMSYDEFFELYSSIIKLDLPFLVAKKDNKIIGFVYLNKFRAKSGYKHTFENSIYIDNKYQGMGIGNDLLGELLEASKKNPNIKNIIAVIGSFDSESSIRIHKKNGFQTIGILKKVG